MYQMEGQVEEEGGPGKMLEVLVAASVVPSLVLLVRERREKSDKEKKRRGDSGLRDMVEV